MYSQNKIVSGVYGIKNEIKKEYESGGITVRGLAWKYFVSKGCIQRIIKGNRYGIL